MRAKDVRMCIRHGANIVGFVVEYPRPVPWNLSAANAKKLLAAVRGPAETCVVTGGPLDHVLRIAMETKPNYMQLHYGESLEDTARLASELGKQGIKIIKAIFPDTPDLEKAGTDFCAAGVYALLFDPRTPDKAEHGGTANLAAYIKFRCAIGCPVILAGGITPENVAGIVRETQAQMIDVMTSVENSPGIKDEMKVIALFQVLQSLKQSKENR